MKSRGLHEQLQERHMRCETGPPGAETGHAWAFESPTTLMCRPLVATGTANGVRVVAVVVIIADGAGTSYVPESAIAPLPRWPLAGAVRRPFRSPQRIGAGYAQSSGSPS